MKKSNFFSILVVMFALAGCSPSSATVQSTPGATQTNTPATSTPSDSPVASITPTAIKDCTDLNPTVFDSSNMDGFLVLRDESNKYYLLDLGTNTIIDIQENYKKIYSYAVSPNKKFMLADAGGDYILRTVNKVIKTLPSTHTEWILWRWLDNQRVVFLSLWKPYDLIILNPFTGDQSIVHLGLPDPYAIKQTETESLVLTSIDTSLKQVFFYDGKNGGRLVLWSIDDKREIVSLPYAIDLPVGFSPSDWSPDGKRFVTAPDSPGTTGGTANELFTIDMDGNVSRLINLKNMDQYIDISSPAWNPDNHHIGFWLKSGNNSPANPVDIERRFTITDVDTQETQIYCPSFPGYSIVWSPSGQQFITRSGDRAQVMVNLVSATQSVIDTQGMWVEDWMAP